MVSATIKSLMMTSRNTNCQLHPFDCRYSLAGLTSICSPATCHRHSANILWIDTGTKAFQRFQHHELCKGYPGIGTTVGVIVSARHIVFYRDCWNVWLLYQQRHMYYAYFQWDDWMNEDRQTKQFVFDVGGSMDIHLFNGV